MKATIDDGFIEISSFNSSKRKRDKFVQIFQTHLFAKFKQAQITWFADISQFIFVEACFESVSFLF